MADTPETDLPDPDTSDMAAQLKKPDLLDQVVGRTSLKKRDVKPAVEAALAVIAEALVRGDEVILPPMGKMRVVKSKELGDGAQVLTLKLRTPKNASYQPQASLADDDDDS